MNINLTYEELHLLLDNNIEMYVDTPTIPKKILNKFTKKSSGYIIQYDDATEIKCSSTHYMQFNNTMKSSLDLGIGDVCDYSGKIVINKIKVKEQEWFDFEIDADDGLYIQNKTINHNSGKSCIIFMIMYFMYKNNKKGYLIVPNINLLDQLYDDFYNYFDEKYSDERDKFLSSIDKQGGGKQSEFDSFLTISTWQSLANRKDVLGRADFILCDELHRYAADVSSSIIKESKNAKYKWGLTGTLPEDTIAKLTLMGLFGEPKRYIRACELIERGLGTPVEIISFIFKYSKNDKALFNNLPKGQYAKQLAYIKEHEKRADFITDLVTKVYKTGTSLILGSHTEHIKTIYLNIMKRLYPDVEVENKNITGKKSFEFQKQYGVFFLNGEDDPKTRELTRKILEEQFYKITLEDGSIIKLHGVDEVILADGRTKLGKDLTEEDDICDNFINNYKGQ